MLFFANIVILSLYRARLTFIFCFSAANPMSCADKIWFSDRNFNLYSATVLLMQHDHAAYVAHACGICSACVQRMLHDAAKTCMAHILHRENEQILSKSHNKCSEKLHKNAEMLTFVIINAPKAPTRLPQLCCCQIVKHHTNY